MIAAELLKTKSNPKLLKAYNKLRAKKLAKTAKRVAARRAKRAAVEKIENEFKQKKLAENSKMTILNVIHKTSKLAKKLPKKLQAKAVKKVEVLTKNIKKIKGDPKRAEIMVKKVKKEAKKVVLEVLPWCKVAEKKTTETDAKTDAETQKKTTETERKLSPAVKIADQTARITAPKALSTVKHATPILCRPRPTKASIDFANTPATNAKPVAKTPAPGAKKF
jgi:hypothetical protein